MSRICRNMGDSGKLRFYELDHESKMRLLKTHSHTSNRLAMGPGTREEKQQKETQTLHQGKSPSKTCRVPQVWRRGAEKTVEPAAYRRCGGGGGRKGSTANRPHKRYYVWRGDTRIHTVTRAIGDRSITHSSCKYEFGRNLRSHSWRSVI